MLLASGGIALILLALLAALYFFFPGYLHFSFIVVAPLLVFALCYFLLHAAIEKFIYGKIKLIYKNIYNLKSSKNLDSEIPDKDMMSKDIIGQVEQGMCSTGRTSATIFIIPFLFIGLSAGIRF